MYNTYICVNIYIFIYIHLVRPIWGAASIDHTRVNPITATVNPLAWTDPSLTYSQTITRFTLLAYLRLSPWINARAPACRRRHIPRLFCRRLWWGRWWWWHQRRWQLQFVRKRLWYRRGAGARAGLAHWGAAASHRSTRIAAHCGVFGPSLCELYISIYLSVYICSLGVGAAVLTQSRHWHRSTLRYRYRMYVTFLLRRVIPPPVDIWLQPGSCAQHKSIYIDVYVSWSVCIYIYIYILQF